METLIYYSGTNYYSPYFDTVRQFVKYYTELTTVILLKTP